MVTVFIFLALLVGTVLFFERRERRYGVSLVPYFLTVIIVTIVFVLAIEAVSNAARRSMI